MLQLYDQLQSASAEECPPEEEPVAALSRAEQLLAAWPEAESLTGREMEVLNYILDNVKRRDIAERMFVSENTVKKHTSHIFSKLGVSSRSELFSRIAADSSRN